MRKWLSVALVVVGLVAVYSIYQAQLQVKTFSDGGKEAMAAEVPAAQDSTAQERRMTLVLKSEESRPAETKDYADLLNCVNQARSIANMDSQLRACERYPDDKEFYSACRARTDGFEQAIATAIKKKDTCNGSDLRELEAKFYRETVASAKGGDPSAQVCFVEGNFLVPRGGTEEDSKADEALAERFAKSAISRGDWRIVHLMMLSPQALAHSNNTLRGLIGKDPTTRYKMNRLARLGAVGDYADRLDIVVEDSKLGLTASQIADAEKWAQQTYAASFKSSPKMLAEPPICTAG